MLVVMKTLFLCLQVPSKREVCPKICNCHYNALTSNSRGSVREDATDAIVPVEFPTLSEKKENWTFFDWIRVIE